MSVHLRADEAVDLGHAWVQRQADAAGIRILFIKGPALHRHGLRTPRTSADVDMLVDPARFDAFCALVEQAGWVERDKIFISERTTLHSRTFVRDGWPVDLDVHSFYPGFLQAPAVVFETLWARRVRMGFARTDCDVLDRVTGVLVLGLHSLRGTDQQARHREELEQLAAVVLTDDEKADAAALARATGSAATLADVLPRLGVAVDPTEAELGSPGLALWRERVESGSAGAYMWALALRAAPWREKPVVVWRAFWPTRHDLLVARPEVVDTVPGRARGRMLRWGRGLASAPNALRALGAGVRARRRTPARVDADASVR